MIYDSMDNAVSVRANAGSALGRIDQYELLQELGGGGFGTVYLARDTVSGVKVAVKGLPPLVKNSREEMENIRSNFALVSRLHHPHIAAALVLHPAREVAYAEEDVRRKLRVDSGDTLMVMEYAPGVTLSKWRRQFLDGVVPFAQALEITRQIASALDYAHERKIVHRDVKPANVMVETAEDGSVTARVLDFGLAAEVRSSMGRVSREIHDTSGTRPYMAPEQWGGDRQGPATDQYALAATFYELVAGRVPFANVFETGDPMIMITVVTTRQPEMPDGLPEPARIALARALAKKPADRFATCGDFAAALAGLGSFGRKERKEDERKSPAATGSEVDAKRARVEAKILERHLRNISDEDGFGGRKTALNEAFQKAEMFFEEKLWADAACQFCEYAEQVKALEKLDSERRAREREEEERKKREESERKTGTIKAITLPGGAEMEMIYVAPGSFMMGSPESEEGRYGCETEHRVTLTKGYWLGKYEVTQRQWESVMGDNPSDFKGNNRPVDNVSWDDCQEFIAKVDATVRRQFGGGARLPTEAEWEYACRAGTTTAYNWGNALNGDRANCDGNNPCGTTVKGRYREETADVGSYSPNAWGFHDMHGNVWEWCQDWYGDYGGDATDPQGPATGAYRVNRGGSWCSNARDCRSANRGRIGPGCRYNGLGFRVALAPSH